ncbi:MucR family transcriptional regulator [Roseivivax sp. CAU 1761]
MAPQEKTDWFRIVEAFAAKDSSTAEDVIQLVAGIKNVLEGQTTPAAQAPAAPAAQAYPPEQTSTPDDQARASEILEQATSAFAEPPHKKTGRSRKYAQQEQPELDDKSKAPAMDATADEGDLGRTEPEEQPVPKANKEPAVKIEDAVQDNEVFCLECGRGMKMLKRHIREIHGFSVEQYKQRWGLPDDFPIAAPKFSESKSKFAKNIGFGRKDSPIAPKRRGRKPKNKAA